MAANVFCLVCLLLFANMTLAFRTNVLRCLYRVKAQDSFRPSPLGTFPHLSSTWKDTRCWLGSKAVPGNPPGVIYIEDNQESLKVDLDRLKSTASRIRSALGYATYDVSIFLVDDIEMLETNLETRAVDAPTDILSFPFHPAIRPGFLKEPDFDIPDYYNLGDMMIDTEYVMRRCVVDRDAKYDSELEDRGVSGAMANVFDPEDRINMLLVHGMLHLLGYDHEDEEDFEMMVTAEENLLRELDIKL